PPRDQAPHDPSEARAPRCPRPGRRHRWQRRHRLDPRAGARVRGAVALAALFGALAAPAHASPGLVKVGDFTSPPYATPTPDDDNRIYIVEKPRVIRIAGQARPSLDITSQTLSDDTERGLLSMAFAPDYATSGRFYVYLTARPSGEIQ